MIKVTIPAGQVPLGVTVSKKDGIATGILTDLNRPGNLVIAYRDSLVFVFQMTEIVWHAEEQELLNWLSGLGLQADREATQPCNKDALHALHLIATIAHCGGWANLTTEESQVAIRRLTIPYMDRGLREGEGRAIIAKALGQEGAA